MNMTAAEYRARLPHLSQGEEAFARDLNALKIPFKREFQFAPPRKWRFDFVIMHCKFLYAVEIEGGTHNTGRHSRQEGFEKDCAKYNYAAAKGWRVFRFTTDMVIRGEAINFIECLLKNEPPQ